MRKFRLRRGGEALYQRLGRKPPFDLAIIVVGFDALWRGAMLQGGAQAAPANRVMIEFLRVLLNAQPRRAPGLPSNTTSATAPISPSLDDRRPDARGDRLGNDPVKKSLPVWWFSASSCVNVRSLPDAAESQ